MTKQKNIDLSSLSYQLIANELCLNVQKIELIISRPAKLKIDPTFKFKLQEKRLVPSHNIKYLGKMKLNRATEILGKLRYIRNFENCQ